MGAEGVGACGRAPLEDAGIRRRERRIPGTRQRPTQSVFWPGIATAGVVIGPQVSVAGMSDSGEFSA